MEKVSSGDDTYLRFNYLEAFPENADIRLITTTTFNKTALISTHLGEGFTGNPLHPLSRLLMHELYAGP